MKRRYYFLATISLLLLFNSGNLFAQDWTQIGADIDGEAAGDRSGSAVSLSSDGSIVAIGANENDGSGANAGHVRVYQNVVDVWTQMGADIDGEGAGDLFGGSVSLNADGTILAVGGRYNDGSGVDAGHVRVYEFVGGVWSQIGADINGEFADDSFGTSVSLSDDGTRLAVGAPLNDDNGSQSGHVKVYENVGGVWTQIGANIAGEAAFDWSGYSCAISGDGNFVVIGAFKNDGTGSFAGHARIYEFSGGTWSQVGADIDGEAAGDECGRAVEINEDGRIVIIGAPRNDGAGASAGHTRVYEFIGGVWTQLGPDFDGLNPGDDAGWSVSINAAGDVISYGSPRNGDAGAESGNLRVFKYTGGVWTQEGTDIAGEFNYDRSGWSTGLNAAGNIVANGAYINDGTGASAGHVRLFRISCDSLDTLVSALEICLGDELTLDGISSGGGTITWDMGVMDGVPFTPASTGVLTYNATSTYGGDCPFSIDILVNDVPTVTASVDDSEICLGESATFTGGGTDSYAWDMGVTDGVPFTPAADGTVTYTVTGTDAATGCENTATVDLTVHPLPVVTAMVSSPEICLGESATFTGGGADSYSWDMGVTDGVAFTPGSAGTETYTVTGTNTTTGCENTASVDLTVNPLPVVTAMVSSAEICIGESVTFTGGGADSYVWDMGVTDGVAFTPAASGTVTYTVIGTNATTGCQNTATIDVTVHDLPTVTASVDDAEICLGESATFNGGGTDSYSWDMGVTDGIPFTPGSDGTVTYTVTGTNESTGCENTATVDLTVHPLPIVTAMVSVPEICLGESATFTGGGADMYTWDIGVLDGVPFTPAAEGTITYTVTGTNTTTGCENTATVDLTVNPLPVVTAAVTDDEICLGASVTFTGGGADSYTWDGGVTDGVPFTPPTVGTTTYAVTGTITATGCQNMASVDLTVVDLPIVTASVTATEICLGESVTFTGGGAETYAWDSGVTDGEPFTPVVTGVTTYTVTGTSAEGCTNTASIDVDVLPLPVVTATAAPAEICFGGSITFTGGGADVYTWTGGATDGIPFTPATVGTEVYTVTGTDATTGCQNTADVEITVYENPTVTATAVPDQLCLGESAVFTGSGADTYTWDGGITDGIPFTPGDIGSFTYNVTGYLGPLACEGMASVTIEVYPLPEVTAIVSDSVICQGETVIFNGGGAITYVWDGGIVDNEPFIAEDAGIFVYTVTGTSADGCENTASVQLLVNPTPDLTASLDTVINTGGIVDLMANTTSTGGSFYWTPDRDVECPTCNVTTASIGENTTFTVIYTDETGCQNSDTVFVAVNFIEGIGVASAFSPNGDGQNDILYVQGYNLYAVNLLVYNKYGELVFETSDQSIGWDGTYRNRDENPGVFSWVLNYNLTNGSTGTISGNTTLFR